MERRMLKSELKEMVLERMDMSRLRTDDEVNELIDVCLYELSQSRYLGIDEREKAAKDVFCAIRRLDFLQTLIDDSSVTEIMVNGPGDIFIEREGALSRYEEVFESSEKLSDIVQQIVASCNRVVNESSPIVDARLSNGSRVNIVVPPVALNGPIITIRRFPDSPFQMQDLIGFGSLTQEIADFLKNLVIAGYNIFVSGGTGSGKTTFLNALSQYIPSGERIITIEDSAELQLKGVENLVRLETRNASNEGCKEISIRDLIKSSLRMRPDRIIVGEVRGAEAIDMLQALNTGHDGSLSTGHANSARDMLSRLETMVLMGMELPLPAIRGQIASGLDVIVHLGRLRDRTRRVLEICEVLDYENGEIQMNPLFEFKETGQDENGRIVGIFEKTKDLERDGKLRAAGL